MNAETQPTRIVIAEDSLLDAELAARAIRRMGSWQTWLLRQAKKNFERHCSPRSLMSSFPTIR